VLLSINNQSTQKSFRYLIYFLAILVTHIALTLPVSAQSFPEATGRVVDQANILSAVDETQLTQKLDALKEQSGRELAVATIADLQGYDIAEYGYQLGRTWGVGNEGKDDGILLIIAPNERKMRIEVGYGLEGIITDGLAGQIIRRNITPFFKQGNMSAGINAGVDALVTQLVLPPEEAAKIAQDAAKTALKSKKSGRVGNLIFWLVIIFIILLPMIRNMRGGRRYDDSGLPIVIWGGGFDNDDDFFGGGGGGGFGGFGGGGFGGGGASGGW